MAEGKKASQDVSLGNGRGRQELKGHGRQELKGQGTGAEMAEGNG